MMILFENEYGLIEYNQEGDFLSMTWKKYTPSTAYRELNTYYLGFLVSTGVLKSLPDLRNLPTVSHEDSRWTVELMKQYYDSLKLNKTATIVHEATFTRLALQSMCSELALTHKEHVEKITHHYFDDVEMAVKWLVE